MDNTNEWEEQKSIGNIWIPNEIGDTLEGDIIDITTGNYGKQYLIETKDGKQVLTPSHKVLQGRMNGIVRGDTVRLVYVGEELPKVKGQKPTKIYNVFKRRVPVENVE